MALVGITAVQTAVTLALVASGGTLGMILADGIGMLLRICYCLWFIARCPSAPFTRPYQSCRPYI